MPASLQTSSDSSPAPTAHPLPPRSVAGALTALSMAMLLASLGTSGANIALPTLARSFSASFQAVQWVVLAYLLAVTTVLVGAGRLGDLLGRRRLLLSGLALFTAASLLGGLAPTLPVLIAPARRGLGAAAMMALAMSLIGAAATPERTGRAMGLLGTMSAVGTALGPSLGGLLIGSSGWRALFLINVPLGLLALWLVYQYVERDTAAPRTSASFDVVGTVLLASSLGAFALTMTVGHGRLSGTNVLLLAGAAIGAAFFLRQQSTAAAPLVPASVLHNHLLATSLATNALVSCVMMSTLIVGPFYLSNTMALTPGLMGLVMTVGPVLTALTGVPGGQLVDKRGAYQASLAGLVAMLMGCALLAALPSRLGLFGYLVPIAFLTTGYALFQAANNTAVMAQAQQSARGVVSGVLGLSRNLGLITGASLMGGVSPWRRACPIWRRLMRLRRPPACTAPSPSPQRSSGGWRAGGYATHSTTRTIGAGGHRAARTPGALASAAGTRGARGTRHRSVPDGGRRVGPAVRPERVRESLGGRLDRATRTRTRAVAEGGPPRQVRVHHAECGAARATRRLSQRPTHRRKQFSSGPPASDRRCRSATDVARTILY